MSKMELNNSGIGGRSLFVVGDDAQSIYAFRGSKIEIILNFEHVYPETKEIILNQNYRSTQSILNLAEKVISHNQKQKKKELFTENKEEVRVRYYLARNERDEAEYIIRQIHEQYVDSKKGENLTNKSNLQEHSFGNFLNEIHLETEQEEFQREKNVVSNMFDIYLGETTNNGISSYQPTSWQVPEYNWSNLPALNDCVILYRTHAQSRSLEETFLKYHLPYKLVSGIRFLDRKEVKDVLAILKFLGNGEDKLSLSRFLPLVVDGVGPKTLDKILAYLEDFDFPLAPKYQQIVIELISNIQSCWQESDNLIDLTKNLINSTGYLKYLRKAYPVKAEYNAKIENIGELYSYMFPFDEDKNIDLPSRLQAFLEQITLMSQMEDKDKENNQPMVSLMSLHQSKGLEFETVFLVGVEDGLLPHQNSLFEQGGLEEEVRLAYVGVTRAKKFLHLIAADSRIQFGQVKSNPVSRIFRPFLDSHCQRQKG